MTATHKPGKLWGTPTTAPDLLEFQLFGLDPPIRTFRYEMLRTFCARFVESVIPRSFAEKAMTGAIQ